MKRIQLLLYSQSYNEINSISAVYSELFVRFYCYFSPELIGHLFFLSYKEKSHKSTTKITNNLEENRLRHKQNKKENLMNTLYK